MPHCVTVRGEKVEKEERGEKPKVFYSYRLSGRRVEGNGKRKTGEIKERND